MLAIRDVESIKLNTRLGNCALDISAQLQNDDKAMQKLGEFALQFLIWHVVPASAYDKKSAFKRDSAYSDALAAHMTANCNSVLADCFKDIAIKTAKYDKPDPIAKLIKEFISLGMSEVDAKAMAAQVQAKTAKPETKVAEAQAEVAATEEA